MLIKWDCATADVAAVEAGLVREAVSELVRAHRRGHHLVVISRPIVDWLIQLGGFSESEISMLSRIRQEFTQNGQVHTQATVYVKVICTSIAEVSRAGRCISVPLHILVRSNISDKPALLTENSTRDGWMYQFFISNMRDRFGCRHVAMDLSHGGGDDIVNVLASHIEGGRIVCSIVDTDKHSPFTEKNQKLNRLLTCLDKFNWPLAFALAPPCREIENMIPFNIILTLDCAKGRDANNLLLDIIALETKANTPISETFVTYFDFKEGIHYEKLAKREDADRAWIVNKLNSVKQDENSCIIQGYGNHIIDQMKRGDKQLSSLRTDIRSSAWVSQFGEFISNVVWIFASNRRVMT